jgi:uncharacterized protein
MEDILASIRRIIAEDQSNNLGRSGLGGLTRRPPMANPAPATEEPVPTARLEETSMPPLPAEPEVHAGPHGDVLQHAYDMAPDEAPAMAQDDVRNDVAEIPAGDALGNDRVFAAHGHDEQVFHAEPAFAAGEDEGEPLMSPMTGASITSSFQTLAESVVLQDPGLIERVMRESMRPLLKSWLDDHLPSIVERLVRTEIERVARGGRARNA